MQFSFFITWFMANFAVASPLGSRLGNDIVVDVTSPVSLIEWADTKKAVRAIDDDEDASPVLLLEWADTNKAIRSTDMDEASPAPLIEWADTRNA
ncbi:hypothetical protein EYC80_002774 [Monilinia laxa]|uniref:Uncharacterized protein n=1 Tax=Monilinia laxa TaxID=61186 RepID=A0A5N6KBP5_MONLA|nr:hypothetical protein EYC80_002774 [Monilinia laxa]